jgi:uncharacterized protein
MDSETYNYIYNESLYTIYNIEPGVTVTNMTFLMRLIQNTKAYPKLDTVIDSCSIKEINQVNSHGLSALAIACQSVDKVTNISTIYKLIEKGANTNITTKFGSTLLYLAVTSDNIELINLLIEKGNDVNKKNNSKRSPVSATCLQSSSNASQILQILFNKGANLNCVDIYGDTPLHDALFAETIRLDVVQFLVDNGANVDALTLKNQTPLYLAINYINNHKDIKIIETLLRAGADPNLLCPLQLACQHKNIQIIQLLLQYKANANQLFNGKTAIDIAIESDFYDGVEMLLEHGADPNIGYSLFNACEGNNIACAKLLLKYKVNVNKINYNVSSKTALCLAIIKGLSMQFIELLLENGADPNIGNAIILACREKSLQTIKLLIEHNINVNKYCGNKTILHFSAETNNLELCKLILSKGADPNIKNSYGLTALEIAYNRHKNVEMLQLLAEKTSRNIVPKYDFNLIDRLINFQTN